MKIVTKNKAFVQLDDIIHIVNSTPNFVSYPQGIKNSYIDYFLYSMKDKTEYVRFTEPEEVEYFRKFDYLLDYFYIKDMNGYEIEQYKLDLIKEKENLVQQLDCLRDEEEEKQLLVAKCELLVHKIYSVIKFSQLSDVEEDFELPDEIAETEQKDIKKLLRKVFGKIK